MANQFRDVATALKGLFDPGDWISMKPQLDPSTSLLALDYKPDPGEVMLRIGIGGFVFVVASIIYYFIDDEVGILVALGFGFFGLLNLILGVLKSRFEKSMLFTGHDVLVRTRGLFGRREWREPLANYRGVLLRERHIGDQGIGNVVSTKTYHIVELAHANPGRTLPLYVRQGMESPRDIQEAFARRFDLPALAPDSGGESARAADALNTPLSAQPAIDPGPPPSGVRVQQHGDSTRIVVGQGRAGAVLVAVSWISIPLIFGGIGYMIEPFAGLMAGGMAVLFVAIMFGAARLVGTKTSKQLSALVVEPDRIWIDRPEFDDRFAKFARRIFSAISGRDVVAATRPPETIPRRAIEQIRVDTYTSHRSGTASGSGHSSSTVHDRLVIEGDGGRLAYIGTQFDRKKLKWVRDYLRHELAGGQSAAD